MTRTLHVTLGPTDHDDLEETMAALDADEAVDPHPSTLVVESLDTLGRIFRPTNLELLGAILEQEPESIRELARLLDRHPPDVLDNVHELADYGLVELREDGRATRPVVWYDELDVDVPLGDGSPDTDAAMP
jgi:predicted transcriptional regulator